MSPLVGAGGHNNSTVIKTLQVDSQKDVFCSTKRKAKRLSEIYVYAKTNKLKNVKCPCKAVFATKSKGSPFNKTPYSEQCNTSLSLVSASVLAPLCQELRGWGGGGGGGGRGLIGW